MAQPEQAPTQQRGYYKLYGAAYIRGIVVKDFFEFHFGKFHTQYCHGYGGHHIGEKRHGVIDKIQIVKAQKIYVQHKQRQNQNKGNRGQIQEGALYGYVSFVPSAQQIASQCPRHQIKPYQRHRSVQYYFGIVARQRLQEGYGHIAHIAQRRSESIHASS